MKDQSTRRRIKPGKGPAPVAGKSILSKQGESLGAVLIVDDEEPIRNLISRKLQSEGYDCVMASDGEIALETASGRDFDLVLLDIKMPGISGIEVLSQIVEDHPDTCVLMSTAVADAQTAVEAMKLGAYDYVIKPFDLDDLNLRVERALERKRLVLENRDCKVRLAEQALEESEDRFRRLVEEMSDGYIVIQDFVAVFANARSAQMLGYTPEEMIGKTIGELATPEIVDELSKIRVGSLHSEAVPQHFETILKRKDGEEFPVEFGVNLIEYAGDHAVSVVMRDITARKQAELALRKYQEQLEAAVEQRTAELRTKNEQLLQSEKLAAIGELVAGVAHELNNPLAAVSLYSELLLEEIDSGDIRERMGIIYSQTERAINIVNKLLSFARKHEPNKSYISVNDSVTGAVELRSYELNLDNIKVVQDLDPDLPMIPADSNQLQQVFLNLIYNAEQAMKETHGRGKLVVQTRKAGDMIQVSFTDDGPGIPADKLKRVFEPFFTTKGVGKGTGLGLSICHGIIHEHGGKIDVESAEGKGTTFTVEIPAIEKDVECVDQLKTEM